MGIFTVEFKDSSGFDWKLLVDTLTMLGVYAGIYIGWHSYAFQKNRDYHEKRLDSVYAPLYGLLCKQEVIRELYLKDHSHEKYPILEFTTYKIKSNVNLFTKESKEVSKEVIATVLEKKAFINVLNESNKGLASSELLRLLNEYEMLLYLEEKLADNQDLAKAQSKTVKVEHELVQEIINGYSESMRKLKLDKNKEIKRFGIK